MEYVFGTSGSAEILKTKGEAHTNLTGFHSVERVYPDQTVTDNFRIVRKLDSQEDCGGNCYDWYEIDSHYRTVDKSGPLARQAAEAAAVLEDAMCGQDASYDERMSALEDAVCELDSIINS